MKGHTGDIKNREKELISQFFLCKLQVDLQGTIQFSNMELKGEDQCDMAPFMIGERRARGRERRTQLGR